MTRDEAHAELLKLAVHVREEGDPAGRLLERVARAESPELSAALVELGAVAAVLEARRPDRS